MASALTNSFGEAGQNQSDEVLLQQPEVQSSPSDSKGSEVVGSSNLLGESDQAKDADAKLVSPPPGPDQPHTFWQMTSAELFAFILHKNPALRADLKGESFTSFDLSTQNLLAMLTVESKDQIFAEIGLDPKTKFIKALSFETFLISEILADKNVLASIQNYWQSVRMSKYSALPSLGGSAAQFDPTVQRKLDFNLTTPAKSSTISLPGRMDPITTPSFYKHIAGSTNSFFHMLSPSSDTLPPAVASFENGQMSFNFNMLPTATIVHPFPSLETFSKNTVPPFLLKYKTAKLGAPAGAKKTLKSCINPLIWSNVAKVCGVDLDTFESSTTDQTIYASLLQKYGPTTGDEAMDLLKSLVFKFDDSITPQENFAGELSNHFVKVREQLAQFLYCKFDEGEELTPEGCILCLKDNFLHNPLIKGPDNGKLVRESSNNARILERITLLKHLPMHQIMEKIVESFEEDDKSSNRKGYKVSPWRKLGENQNVRNGGVQKQNFQNRNANQNQRPKYDPCCKCGRNHEASIEKCLLFDHPDANKDNKWPAGKPPMKLETPEAWTSWISKKEKTHPDLVKEFKKRSEDRKNQGGQGNHGGGKPPRYQNKGGNGGNKVNSKNYVGLNAMHAGEWDEIDESDGAKHGHADHVTSVECADEVAILCPLWGCTESRSRRS